MTEERDFQTELKDNAHKIWLAGLGALQAAEEEGSKLFNNLVERGQTFENRGRERYDDVRVRYDNVKDQVGNVADEAKDRAGSTWENIETKVDDAVGSALGRLGVPSRDEIATLTLRVEELTALVEKLKPAKKAPAKKAPARKAPTSSAAK